MTPHHEQPPRNYRSDTRYKEHSVIDAILISLMTLAVIACGAVFIWVIGSDLA